MYSLLTNWTVGRKIALIVALYTVCSGAVVGFLVSKLANKDIAFTQLELAGDRFQEPLERALIDVQWHRVLAAGTPAPNSAAYAELIQSQQDATQAFADIAKADGEL